MKYIEGKVWSVRYDAVTVMAAKVTKHTVVIADTAEKAMGSLREACGLNIKITSVWLMETYDGTVVE